MNAYMNNFMINGEIINTTVKYKIEVKTKNYCS